MKDVGTKVKRYGSIAVATAGWVGYFPIASGTAGSLVGIFLISLIGPLPIMLHIGLCVLLILAGVWSSNLATYYFGEEDSSKIVIDEIVGVAITMIGIPLTSYWLAVGFIVFRFFDIAKIPPASYFDTKRKDGWGVVLDDAISGVYANILLRLMLLSQI